VLGLLQHAGLQVKPQKHEFYKTTREYLRILMTLEGLKMDSSKVSAVEKWPIPQWLCNICVIIGFSNFY
jgi:hypothetical protein